MKFNAMQVDLLHTYATMLWARTEYVILDDGTSMSEMARSKSCIAQENVVWIGDPEALRAFNADEAAVDRYPWRAGTLHMNTQVHNGDKVLMIGLFQSSVWKFQRVRDYPGCIRTCP